MQPTVLAFTTKKQEGMHSNNSPTKTAIAKQQYQHHLCNLSVNTLTTSNQKYIGSLSLVARISKTVMQP